MPNLEDEAVETYWQSKGRDLARTVGEIERLEDWQVDSSPRLREAIIDLGNEIEEAPEGRMAEMSGDQMTVDSARIALAYMKAGKRFRILAAMAEERSDGAALAANILSPNADDLDAAEAARVLRASVRHLARLNLLNKVFAPERLKLIMDAITDEKEEA